MEALSEAFRLFEFEGKKQLSGSLRLLNFQMLHVNLVKTKSPGEITNKKEGTDADELPGLLCRLVSPQPLNSLNRARETLGHRCQVTCCPRQQGHPANGNRFHPLLIVKCRQF